MPHPHRLNIKDVIHQALHKGAQGIVSPSKLSTADESSQEDEDYQVWLKEYNEYLSAIKDHTVIISVITQIINNSNTPWPTIEPAKKQVLILPHTEKLIVHSGSKRCREAAVEYESRELVKRQDFLSETSHFDTLCFLGLSLYCRFVYSYILMSAVWITVCNRSRTHTTTWLPLARSETWLHTCNTQ